MPEDPHAPLREDVRLLGGMLGDTLKEHAGEALFETVERVRALSKRARGGDEEGAAQLRQILGDLPLREASAVARAFAHFLALANIAEQHHRVRRRRAYNRDEAPPQRGSAEDAFRRLRERGVDADALHAAVTDMRVELVLTAHPTEVTRRTLLRKHNRIAALLATRDRPDLTRDERAETRADLRREIASVWLTDEIRRHKPTPVDEAKSGLAVIEQVLWDVVPRLLRQLDGTLRAHTGRGLPLDAAPVTFGSWMGGDRDGNPNVTPDVTREVLNLQRWLAAELYVREVDALRQELSMVDASEALRRRSGGAHEPYRAFLKHVRARLEATRASAARHLPGGSAAAGAPPDVAPYARAEALRADLMLCYESLVESGARVVAEGRLRDLLRRLAVFGLTLVRLDVRQESTRHTEALDAVTRHLGLGAYAEWSEAERQQFLLDELAGRRPLIPPDLPASEAVRDVLDTFRVIAEEGPDAFGAYVISMARAPSDVLAVALLQKEARIARPLRIVPLFETLDDLRNAGDTMRRLLAIDLYREWTGLKQEVMIGYSDSAKDAGILAAAWEIYRAQEEVVAACRDADVRLTLFHGRGGSPGRGGAPAHQAILSQPPGAVNGTLRVTEQGEVIQSRFGLPGIAMRTLELYLSGTLEATLAPPAPPAPEWRKAMDGLAETAVGAYRDVVRGDARFVPYFRAATPEQELAGLKIGSRPAKRRAEGGLESLRAIPWVFAWTQNRLILPAWLGVGDAFDRAIAGGEEATLRTMREEWPFFRVFLDLVEMVLAKADPGVAARYDEVLVGDDLADLGETLRARLDATRQAVHRVQGHENLLDGNPVLQRSIAVRNPYVDPINLLQVEFLRRLRAEEEAPPDLEDALLVAINGVAAGMRNTG